MPCRDGDGERSYPLCQKGLEHVFHSMGVVMHTSHVRLVENSWITGLPDVSERCYTSPISIVLTYLLALFPPVVLKQSLGRKAEP